MIMKLKLLAIVILLSSSATFAQIKKGQWMIGGDATFTSTKYTDNPTITELSFNPAAGYFFMDKLAGGLRVDISTASYGSGSGSATSFFGSPFLRYYFLPVAQKVNLFADASYGIGSVSATGADTKSTTLMRIMVGPSIFLNQHTALQIAPFYRRKGATDLDDKTDTFGMAIGLQIHIGPQGK